MTNTARIASVKLIKKVLIVTAQLLTIVVNVFAVTIQKVPNVIVLLISAQLNVFAVETVQVLIAFVL